MQNAREVAMEPLGPGNWLRPCMKISKQKMEHLKDRHTVAHMMGSYDLLISGGTHDIGKVDGKPTPLENNNVSNG